MSSFPTLMAGSGGPESIKTELNHERLCKAFVVWIPLVMASLLVARDFSADSIVCLPGNFSASMKSYEVKYANAVCESEHLQNGWLFWALLAQAAIMYIPFLYWEYTAADEIRNEVYCVRKLCELALLADNEQEWLGQRGPSWKLSNRANMSMRKTNIVKLYKWKSILLTVLGLVWFVVQLCLCQGSIYTGFTRSVLCTVKGVPFTCAFPNVTYYRMCWIINLLLVIIALVPASYGFFWTLQMNGLRDIDSSFLARYMHGTSYSKNLQLGFYLERTDIDLISHYLSVNAQALASDDNGLLAETRKGFPSLRCDFVNHGPPCEETPVPAVMSAILILMYADMTESRYQQLQQKFYTMAGKHTCEVPMLQSFLHNFNVSKSPNWLSTVNCDHLVRAMLLTVAKDKQEYEDWFNHRGDFPNPAAVLHKVMGAIKRCKVCVRGGRSKLIQNFFTTFKVACQNCKQVKTDYTFIYADDIQRKTKYLARCHCIRCEEDVAVTYVHHPRYIIRQHSMEQRYTSDYVNYEVADLKVAGTRYAHRGHVAHYKKRVMDTETKMKVSHDTYGMVGEILADGVTIKVENGMVILPQNVQERLNQSRVTGDEQPSISSDSRRSPGSENYYFYNVLSLYEKREGWYESAASTP